MPGFQNSRSGVHLRLDRPARGVAMPEITIYHYPHCHSSRRAVEAATEAGIDFMEIQYMKEPLDESTLRDVISKLEDPVENMVRKDARFKKLALQAEDYVDNPDTVVAVLQRYPSLLQRPLLVRSDKAIIGRPLGKVKVKERLSEFWS